MKRYKTIEQLVDAIRRGDIPRRVISPGAAAAALGITRQSTHELCHRGVLRSWYAERIILIDEKAVQDRCKMKQGIPEEQGELYDSE